MRALFIRGRQVIFAAFIDIKEISLPVDRGRVRHAADLPGSAESTFSGGRIQSTTQTA